MASEVLSAKGYSAEVNVLAFDADPTGVADSTAAFAKAITECKKKDYSTLYVPAGTYKFAMTNTEPAFKIENVNGLCIRGDGALRSESQDGHFVGTKLVFVLLCPEPWRNL